jgi:hypothetical protein
MQQENLFLAIAQTRDVGLDYAVAVRPGACVIPKLPEGIFVGTGPFRNIPYLLTVMIG